MCSTCLWSATPVAARPRRRRTHRRFPQELDIHIENTYLVLNRMPALDVSSGDGSTVASIPEALLERIDKMDIPLLGVIPADEQLTRMEFSGQPLVELGDDSPTYQAVAKMLQMIL